MMRYATLSVLLLLAPVAAHAQSPAPAPQASQYCLAASAGFLQSESQGFAELHKCQRGDTIIIPGGSTSAVARVCDFTKAVVLVGGNIICVTQGTERARRQ
jgi:hypothetical protein